MLHAHADGPSHLDLASPAVHACVDIALLDVDLEGRLRIFNFASDAGAFEASNILFQDGFEGGRTGA
jgi:hypothetical protein